MDIEAVARIFAEKLKQEHDFERCTRAALDFAVGLNIVYNINETNFMEALAAQDSRFKKGYVKKRIFVPTNKLNPSGTVYINRGDLAEARSNGDYVILTVMGKGY